jgi:Uma2 family endonuclease
MTEHRPLNTSPLPVRLRLEDYLLLDESGAFEGYAKTELIAGEIFYVNAQYRPHALAKMQLYDALRDALRSINSDLRAMVEVSIALPPDGAPEPDIVLTSEPHGEGLVPLSSVALVIEVSDATLDTDLGRKASLYASAGIAEYWVADINARVVHQMWKPSDDAYAERRSAAFGIQIVAATIKALVAETSGL